MMVQYFDESNKDVVNIRDFDSTALQLLVDYIYTGEILVSDKNVQDLLPAADLLQLDYVKGACAAFLQTQLDPTNCLSIRAFADLHNCLELLSSCEAYIKRQFLYIVKNEEFLSLSSQEMINLISSNVLNTPSEEKVYECVINWIKHKLCVRYDDLPKLMEHIRLPLLSIEYISINVIKESLIKNNPKCKDFLIEALHFHALKTQQIINIPQTIRNTPRKSGQKIILMFNELSKPNWYDPATNSIQVLPEIEVLTYPAAFALVKERFVFAISLSRRDIKMLDLSLHPFCWVSVVSMSVERLGSSRYGVLNDCLYAIGGHEGNDNFALCSAEFFDMKIQKWRMITDMSTKRCFSGVGVLNNLLYVIGGCSSLISFAMKSVECYDPCLHTWTPVAEMTICRESPGVGVLLGVLYAVGGVNKSGELKSIEAYTASSGVWSSTIPDMHFTRCNPDVLALDGLLYIMGGRHNCSNNECTFGSTVEIYNPHTNTWSMETLTKSLGCYGRNSGVVVDKLPYIINN
ncbi:kelch-like protein 2 isoform X2 [Myzus persicae]|uniref:kelch-like protein 2 isoform X2 n=1 Tax=Myzus persicae TaxID=13164 RepID=UPI000B9372F7|nr:kelch-like protein 2 isoform X2 [Myzus persicae]